jgi:hypothetical protein
VPIETPQLPPDAVEAVRRALSATGRFPQRRGARLSLTSPHPVYSADLAQLAAGDPLTDAAELIGWRVLLEEDEQVVAAIELPGAEPGKIPAEVNRGPFVRSTIEALSAAERDERAAGAERVELRLLRVNALYLLALWLHASSSVFVPLSPAPPPLRAGATYESAAFEQELSEMARSVASAYEAADRPGELGS